MAKEEVLPFARGTVMDSASDTLSDTVPCTHLEGRIYDVTDSVHGTGQTVKLRVVKNNQSTSITVARKCMGFATGALDLGRRVSGTPSAGAPAKPIDDAYTVGSTITGYALFYVVEAGPCTVSAETTGTTLAQWDAVTVDANGLLDSTKASTSACILGLVDTAQTATSEGLVVHVVPGFQQNGYST